MLFGAVSVIAQVFFDYKRYVAILKWLTLVLFAYVMALAVVKVSWEEALKGLLIPKIKWDGQFLNNGWLPYLARPFRLILLSGNPYQENGGRSADR